MLKHCVRRTFPQAFRVGPVARIGRRSSTHTPWRKDTTPEPSVFVEENFAKHTLFVLDVGKRILKFSAVGLFALGATAATVYEGVHIWIENVELAPESDEEVKRWGWDQETDRWTGDHTRGGTDSALGLKGRHTVRAAWMAQNWGVGHSTAVIGSDTARGEGLVGPGGLNVIDARLQRTEDFLRTAISIAEKKSLSGKLDSHTLTELFARHANVLERLGAQFLPDSKTQYSQVWSVLPEKGLYAARIAAKLGDLSSRLGQGEDALRWWLKAIQIIQGRATETMETPSIVVGPAPSSPSAQRLLSTTLVSLSAFYAQSGNLRQAQYVEETALKMLRSIRPPESFASATPPQALHALYLLQRSSLLSVHLAEVLHAQREPVALPVQWLTSAAESSERVARILTGIPLNGSDNSITPVPLEQSALQIYTSSRSMKKVANGLLRDARRTAAEAWNLIGILKETQSHDMAAALRCYERAIDWAGTPPDQSGERQAAGDVLESDWSIFWGNYRRVRRLMEQIKT